VRLTLAPGTPFTPNARLRIEEPVRLEGGGTFRPTESFRLEREAYVIPLGEGVTQVMLREATS
jgi:hypothetical protein